MPRPRKAAADTQAAANDTLSLQLAARISERAETAFADGKGPMMQQVTPLTAELLRYWFTPPHTDERPYNFHTGQRNAILAAIYLHEALGIKTVLEIYERCAPDLLAEADLAELAKEKYAFPKYAIKMATGTGKTWVMHALLIWQLLNARHEQTPSGRFVRHFLIVAPGLIVYDRLLDAFKGRLTGAGGDERNAETNDYHRQADLFLPPQYRDEVFSFIAANTVSKEEGIGRKLTADGLIALTNWHLFLTRKAGSGDTAEDAEDEEDEAPLTPPEVVEELLPLKPAATAGNALDTLDTAFLRGTEIDYLAELPELMVINDEAHHIHGIKSAAAEKDEVEWQRGLTAIAAGKGSRFVQVDVTATPYETSGTGRNQRKRYFPHIITDFDLRAAVTAGLVKLPALDQRQQIEALKDLDFRAVRDEYSNRVIGLSKGQRLMLRAGLTRLTELERAFVKLDPQKHPKMLVLCEDTAVTPFVEQFLLEEGQRETDVLRIDSSKKGELKESEWLRVKERLFNIDRYAEPRIIVSVLMLREGFDVSNICVIVPLRSTQAPILLEQTVGRGLRLMWREPEYREEKEQARWLKLVEHKEPTSYLDMLFIIEHPAFRQFYNDMMGGLVVAQGDSRNTQPTGDLITVGLREGWEAYDFAWPVITHEAEEELTTPELPDPATLEPFTSYSLYKLQQMMAKPGTTFVSQDLTTETTFGRYVVRADLFSAESYNEYLQKVLTTVTTRLDRIGRATRGLTTLQINQAKLMGLLDRYIRTHLFSQSFDPFIGNNWKILLSARGLVTQHVVKVMSQVIYDLQHQVRKGTAEVQQTSFASVTELKMRESYSAEVTKCIYPRLGWPSSGGGLEEQMIAFLDHEGTVERFLKIGETAHSFAYITYLREDGLMATYHPDFLAATATDIYIIETKADRDATTENVRRKELAAVVWCERINALPAAQRDNRTWHYILITEQLFALTHNGARLADLVRLAGAGKDKATLQGKLWADM